MDFIKNKKSLPFPVLLKKPSGYMLEQRRKEKNLKQTNNVLPERKKK
jgi:hypothetical protein